MVIGTPRHLVRLVAETSGEALNPGPLPNAGGLDDDDFDPMDRIEVDDVPPPPLMSDDDDEPVTGADSESDDDQEMPREFAAAWEAAEDDVGARITPQQPRQATATRTTPSPLQGEDFIPAKLFAGAVDGFAFTTKDKETGYYRLPDRIQPKWLCLDELVHTDPPKLPRRRLRDMNGRRIRHAKRQTCDGDPATLDAIVSGLSDLTDRSWKECKLWAVDTSNPNSWTSAENTVMLKSSADVILLQETKRYGFATAKMVTAARNIGWNAVPSEALRTAADKASGGCMVAARKGNGITPHPDSLVKDGFGHRIKLAWVAGFLAGGLHIGSVYLKDGVGLDDTNLELLQEIAGALKQLQGPWVLGGDWNVTPQILAQSKWLDMIGGMIVAPDAPTCHDSVYDFFVVDKKLHLAIAGVARLNDAGTNPHWPARLFIHSDARRQLSRQLVRPMRVAGILPHGPLPCPDASRVAPPASVDEGEIDRAMSSWWDAAKHEWASLTGDAADTSQPRFAWKPVVGPKAKQFAGECSQSSFWRNFARRIDECAAMVDRRRSIAPSVAHLHFAALDAALNHARIEGDDYEFAAKTLDQACTRMTFGDTITMRRLAAVATKRALQLETNRCNAKLAEWRKSLSSATPGSHAPTRVALQWVKGASRLDQVADWGAGPERRGAG